MAEILGYAFVQQDVRLRDEKGQFLAECHKAAGTSALQLAKAVERFADEAAWGPSKPITAEMTGGTSAKATAWGRTAAIQEGGAKPHLIATDKGALANRETGFFVPNPFREEGGGVVVHHPGVKARHFLSEAGRMASSLAIGILRANFPS